MRFRFIEFSRAVTMFWLVINHRYQPKINTLKKHDQTSLTSSNHVSACDQPYIPIEIKLTLQKVHVQTPLTNSLSIWTHLNISTRIEQIQNYKEQLLDDSVDIFFMDVNQMLIHFQACLYSPYKFGNINLYFLML